MGISEEKYRESINYYLQKVEFFKGRVDEQRMNFQEITRLEEAELKKILQQFRISVNSTLGINDMPRENTHQPKQSVAEEVPLFKKINTQYRTQPHP